MFRGRVREWILAAVMLSLVGATILNARETERLRNLPPQVDTVVVTEVRSHVDTVVLTQVDTVLHVESRIDTVHLEAPVEVRESVVWYPVSPLLVEPPVVQFEVVEQRSMSHWERLGWAALGFGIAVGIDYFSGPDTEVEIRYVEVPKRHCSGCR